MFAKNFRYIGLFDDWVYIKMKFKNIWLLFESLFRKTEVTKI